MQRRNLGVDLLRSLSMLMVVVLHVLGQGGVLAAQPPGTAGHALAWLLEAACYCAVNCFGLVSGYVSHRETLSARPILSFWTQAAFYSAGITLLFRLFVPGTASFRGVVRACFPVITQTYWYVTAYFGLVFLIPYLNTLLRSLSVERAKGLMAVLLVLLSAVPTLTGRDLFHTRAGYTLLWLCALFLLGGCLKKLGPDWGPGPGGCLLGYLACVALTAGSKLLPEVLSARSGLAPPRTDVLLSYTSPTVVLAAILLLLLFGKLPVRSGPVARGISFFAPLAFGVYLVHTHPLIWNVALAGRFAPFAARPAPVCLLLVLLTAGAIFLLCAGADYLRLRLFRWAGARLLRLSATK